MGKRRYLGKLKAWMTEGPNARQVHPDRRRQIERMVQLARRRGMSDVKIARHYRMSFPVVARITREPADRFEMLWARAFPKGASYGPRAR